MDDDHQHHHDRAHRKDQDLRDREIRIGQGIADVAEGDEPGNDDHGVGHAKTEERSRQPGAHYAITIGADPFEFAASHQQPRSRLQVKSFASMSLMSSFTTVSVVEGRAWVSQSARLSKRRRTLCREPRIARNPCSAVPLNHAMGM
jgi:hypothetical protein